MSEHATRRFSFPSSEFPGFARILLDVPLGWEAVAHPAAVMMIATSEDPEFRTNAVVRVQRASADIDVAALIERGNEALRAEHPDFRIQSREETELNGTPTYRQAHQFTPAPDAAPIYQEQVVTTVRYSHLGIVDVVQLHLTCARDNRSRYAEAFSAITNSFRVSPDLANGG